MVYWIIKSFQISRLGSIAALLYLLVGGWFYADALRCQLDPGNFGGLFGCTFGIFFFFSSPLLLIPFLPEKFIEAIFIDYVGNSIEWILDNYFTVGAPLLIIFGAVIAYILGWLIEKALRMLYLKVFS